MDEWEAQKAGVLRCLRSISEHEPVLGDLLGVKNYTDLLARLELDSIKGPETREPSHHHSLEASDSSGREAKRRKLA